MTSIIIGQEYVRTDAIGTVEADSLVPIGYSADGTEATGNVVMDHYTDSSADVEKTVEWQPDGVESLIDDGILVERHESNHNN